ncbi:MAG TPA: hypothetical protein VMA72_03540 [Streptosporangiaceae bacterium]|nr:hypothetical protein [Streptosporangiaceae bacterium]
MIANDEDLLRDLMHRATGDLHARREITAGVITTCRRRHRRTRALGLSVTGAAAATAIAAAVGSSAPAGPGRTSGPVIKLTAAQRTLTHLSAAAAAATAPTGRWVKMTELAGKQRKITIIDTRTGDVWTVQPGVHGAPRELFSRAGLPTAAQLAAYPTSVPALRAFLIRQASRQAAETLRFFHAQAMATVRKHPGLRGKKLIGNTSQPKETSDDTVFAQAAYTLWNPAISPALRSALLKVIAATPGVVVNSHARDGLGRSAVEISRYDSAASYTEAVYETPDAARVLETSSLRPATPAMNGRPAEKAYQLSDTYLSIVWSATRPSA